MNDTPTFTGILDHWAYTEEKLLALRDKNNRQIAEVQMRLVAAREMVEVCEDSLKKMLATGREIDDLMREVAPWHLDGIQPTMGTIAKHLMGEQK